ncbi:DUF551 domain-containing protein [Phytohalomonas tamaricis]|uniref:DUF551 domain-containing protein n=1 Tax=Phytohalomonas tamaricis TaxID=2081032 RepID=UPI00374E08EC
MRKSTSKKKIVASKWTKITQELPPEGTIVLTYNGLSYGLQCFENQEDFRQTYNENPTVTHWMSLPSPPELDK